MPPSSPQTSRRSLLRQMLGAPFVLGLVGVASLGASPAYAGGQIEEPLADAVRSALSAAVSDNSAPPVPVFVNNDERDHYQIWLTIMSLRLARRRPFMNAQEREELLQTVWYEAKRAGLEVSLVLGLITVESNFRKFAISSVGARGFMQVMPFWSRLIGDGHSSRLFHMQTNLRFGCVILRHYLDIEHGDTFMALGRYNGSRGQPQYPDAVFAAQRNWILG